MAVRVFYSEEEKEWDDLTVSVSADGASLHETLLGVSELFEKYPFDPYDLKGLQFRCVGSSLNETGLELFLFVEKERNLFRETKNEEDH
ncbi:hypothetical protein [Timonella sp. A28]|uniref:hypothetical protein n=1 Tax=Timonella sp. A28 TaxID=3442640 RepID=UPI003EBF0680